jgi:predicted amidophosphoribosyltransferase
MLRRRCPSCQNLISKTDQSCWSCGRDLEAWNRSVTVVSRWLLCAIVAAVVGGIIVLCLVKH